MSASTTQPFAYPISGKGLDFVKIMAVIFMIIDHVNSMILKPIAMDDPLLLLLGRGAFPLFAYATAAAMIRSGTDKAQNYATQLFIWGLFTHAISYLTRDTAAGNVFFTLAFGALLVPYVISLSQRQKWMLYVICVFTNAFPVLCEFGFPGILLPSLIYMYLKGDKSVLKWLILFAFLMNIPAQYHEFIKIDFIISATIILIFAMILSFGTLYIASNFSDQGRYLHRYALHIFYPTHLALFGLIGQTAPIWAPHFGLLIDK